MRAALPLLVAIAFLLAPLAAADQSLGAGPASARTMNATTGDGSCDAGSNSSETHEAHAQVVLTQHESLFVEAYSACYASAWDDGRGNWDSQVSSILLVSAGRQTDASQGPFVVVDWYDYNETASWGTNHYCGSIAYVTGPALFMGCWPNGEAPPMLPMLP
jgi:hypothetical protein